jgi:hypothetical protein
LSEAQLDSLQGDGEDDEADLLVISARRGVVGINGAMVFCVVDELFVGFLGSQRKEKDREKRRKMAARGRRWSRVWRRDGFKREEREQVGAGGG